MKIKDLFQLMYTISIFFMSASIVPSVYYRISGENLPLYISYIALTSIGLFTFTFILNIFLAIKTIDLEYFKGIMVGISGGLAVWVFSSIEMLSKENSWMYINDLLIKICSALLIIIIGYTVYKSKWLKLTKK